MHSKDIGSQAALVCIAMLLKILIEINEAGRM